MVAVEFGKHSNSLYIRLVPESQRWPDFVAKDAYGEEGVECVEAFEPWRKRGYEYKTSQEITHDPEEDWIKRLEAIPDILKNAIYKKIGKRYERQQVNLFIYSNSI